MALIKLKVDGGSGSVYVESDEIAAIMPAMREMDGGSVILLRASESGVNVLESPDEVYDIIVAWGRTTGMPTREGVYRVPRDRDGS